MKVHVIITDDDPVALFLQKIIVKKSEFSVDPLVFPGARETLEYFSQHYQPGQQYLILLDINMPVMNGWQMLEAMCKQQYANSVYVVMVTSSVNSADREKAQTYKPVIGFLEKPMDVQMMNTIKQQISVLMNTKF